MGDGAIAAITAQRLLQEEGVKSRIDSPLPSLISIPTLPPSFIIGLAREISPLKRGVRSERGRSPLSKPFPLSNQYMKLPALIDRLERGIKGVR